MIKYEVYQREQPYSAVPLAALDNLFPYLLFTNFYHFYSLFHLFLLILPSFLQLHKR